MPPASDPLLLTLLGLRLASFAPEERVAEVVGLPADDVLGILERCRDKEWCRHLDGAVKGWALKPAGRAEGERLLAEELEATGAGPDVLAAYRQFLTLNQPLLQVCTDWQLREVDGVQVVNDHSDADHDANVVGELAAIDTEVQPVCGELAEALGRFGGYGARLAAARSRIEAGDGDWFTKPTIDSYHTVWFELHENLLATLGIERGREETA